MQRKNKEGNLNDVFMCQKSQQTKYLVVVSDRGIVSEVNHFTSLKEAKRVFGEIAHDYGYRPSEINGSDKYDVSIWEWIEDRYEKIYYYA